VRWRGSDALRAPGGPAPSVAGLAVTDRHVVAGAGGRWHLLARADGTTTASEPACGDTADLRPSSITAPDRAVELAAGRFYTSCDGGVVVVGLDDLLPVSRGPAAPVWEDAYPADGHLVTFGLAEDWNTDVTSLAP
jgi:hypothetical protein